MVEIVAYQPAWVDEFTALARDLRHVLDGQALAIHHIGSTSVPGLAAKDVIDIQISVAELSESVRQALVAAGFVHKAHIHGDHVPPGAVTDPVTDLEEWRKMIFAERPGERRANIHVRVVGRANQRYPILFRDYLRTFPAQAEAYAQVKLALAKHYPADHNMDVYYDIKDPVCDILIGGAELWAAQTGWRLPESDG